MEFGTRSVVTQVNGYGINGTQAGSAISQSGAPFTTHEGSGLGSCVKDVKKAYPKANVEQGFSIYGHDVRTGKERVEKWLKKLGYTK